MWILLQQVDNKKYNIYSIRSYYSNIIRIAIKSLFLSLTRLDVLEYDGKSVGILAEFSHHSDRAADSLANSSVSSELGETDPFTELLAFISHDQGDIAFTAKCLDKLGEFSIITILG